MDKKLLGKRINTARKDRKLTGEKLAEACNINATFLRQIESGTKIPSLPVFVTICNELKASPSYLLADALTTSDARDMDILFEMMNKVTPTQMRMITAIVQAALNVLDE